MPISFIAWIFWAHEWLPRFAPWIVAARLGRWPQRVDDEKCPKKNGSRSKHFVASAGLARSLNGRSEERFYVRAWREWEGRPRRLPLYVFKPVDEVV